MICCRSSSSRAWQSSPRRLHHHHHHRHQTNFSTKKIDHQVFKAARTYLLTSSSRTAATGSSSSSCMRTLSRRRRLSCCCSVLCLSASAPPSSSSWWLPGDTIAMLDACFWLNSRLWLVLLISTNKIILVLRLKRSPINQTAPLQDCRTRDEDAEHDDAPALRRPPCARRCACSMLLPTSSSCCSDLRLPAAAALADVQRLQLASRGDADPLRDDLRGAMESTELCVHVTGYVSVGHTGGAQEPFAAVNRSGRRSFARMFMCVSWRTVTMSDLRELIQYLQCAPL